MNAIDRTIVLQRLRQIAVGDSAYVLRAYAAAHDFDIAEALGIPVTAFRMGFRGTSDEDINRMVVEMCDHPPESAPAEWSNVT